MDWISDQLNRTIIITFFRHWLAFRYILIRNLQISWRLFRTQERVRWLWIILIEQDEDTNSSMVSPSMLVFYWSFYFNETKEKTLTEQMEFNNSSVSISDEYFLWRKRKISSDSKISKNLTFQTENTVQIRSQ